MTSNQEYPTSRYLKRKKEAFVGGATVLACAIAIPFMGHRNSTQSEYANERCVERVNELNIQRSDLPFSELGQRALEASNNYIKIHLDDGSNWICTQEKSFDGTIGSGQIYAKPL